MHALLAPALGGLDLAVAAYSARATAPTARLRRRDGDASGGPAKRVVSQAALTWRERDCDERRIDR